MAANSVIVPHTLPATDRRALWLARLAWGLTVVLIGAGVVYQVSDGSADLLTLGFALVLLAFGTVGALIVARRPGNRIGAILCVGTILWALGDLALEYAAYALRRSLPGVAWMAWLGGALRGFGFIALVGLVPLFFPDGTLPSPRWRPLAIFAIGWIVISTVLTLFTPNTGDLEFASTPTPFGFSLASNVSNFLDVIHVLGFGATIALGAAAVILRLRHATGDERLQLKWFAYAAAFALFIFGIIVFGVFFLSDATMSEIGGALFFLAVAGFPFAIGIAILKYRLYNIDLLINRTLVYVPLTAILAGIFSATIALSQKLFVAVTGQSSDAATIVTTLFVVALFDPLKKWLQEIVDKRFKTAHDPATQLKPFSNSLDERFCAIDSPALARRLLNESLKAFDALGGAVFLRREGEMQLIKRVGDAVDEYPLTIPLETNGGQVGLLSLGARTNGADYTPAERATLQQIAELVASAMATEQIPGPR